MALAKSNDGGKWIRRVIEVSDFVRKDQLNCYNVI